MADRFDELGEKVRAECDSYVLRASPDGRARVIAEALRNAYRSGNADGYEAGVLAAYDYGGNEQMRDALLDAAGAVVVESDASGMIGEDSDGLR